MTPRCSMFLTAIAFALTLLAAAGAAHGDEEESIRVSKQLSEAYRESFAPPADQNDVTEQRLEELIEKVNAISLPETASPRRQVRAPQTPDLQAAARQAAPEASGAAGPDEKPASTEEQDADQTDTAGADQTSEDKNTDASKADASLPAPVLRAVTEKTPEAMADPLRLADALFASGHRLEAFKVYQEQLEATDDPEDQAWLVYQMANCLITTNPGRALELYRRVIAEFPESSWAPLARSNLALLEWLDENRPRQFLTELAQDTDDQ